MYLRQGIWQMKFHFLFLLLILSVQLSATDTDDKLGQSIDVAKAYKIADAFLGEKLTNRNYYQTLLREKGDLWECRWYKSYDRPPTPVLSLSIKIPEE